MAHKTLKPAKPSLTPARIQWTIVVAIIASILTLVAAYAVATERWPMVAWSATWGATLLAWIGLFFMISIRHVTRYIYECEKRKAHRQIHLEEIIRRGSLVDEAEQYLRGLEN